MNEELNVKTNQNKGKSILVKILFLIIGIIIGSSSIIIYNKFIAKEEKNIYVKEENCQNTEAEDTTINEVEKEEDTNSTQEETPPAPQYDYSNLTGIYEFSKVYEDGSSRHASLKLYENGNFWYDKCPGGGCFGYTGNYLIEDNKLILNYIISFGSDADADVGTTENKVEFSIIDSSTLESLEETTVKLSKTDKKITNQDLFDELNSRIINSEASKGTTGC